MRRESLTSAQLVILGVGVALAVVPSLPFLISDSAAFTRFRSWAIFVGGLVIGAVLATVRGGIGR